MTNSCDHTIGQMFGDKLVTFDEALEEDGVQCQEIERKENK